MLYIHTQELCMHVTRVLHSSAFLFFVIWMQKLGSYHWYCACTWGWGWQLLHWHICVNETWFVLPNLKVLVPWNTGFKARALIFSLAIAPTVTGLNKFFSVCLFRMPMSTMQEGSGPVTLYRQPSLVQRLMENSKFTGDRPCRSKWAAWSVSFQMSYNIIVAANERLVKRIKLDKGQHSNEKQFSF